MEAMLMLARVASSLLVGIPQKQVTISADAISKPAASKEKKIKVAFANPLCCVAEHAKFKRDGSKRQRHTCYKCLREDLDILNCNEYLTRWDVACTLVSMTRSYCCSICLLLNDAKHPTPKQIPKAGNCKKHSVFNSQHKCRHGLRWTSCTECLFDLRSATSLCKFCAKRGGSGCKCPRGPIALRDATAAVSTQQPEDQLCLKKRLAADIIQYAHALQAVKDDPVAIEHIKATFPFASDAVCRLRSALELHYPAVASHHDDTRKRKSNLMHTAASNLMLLQSDG